MNGLENKKIHDISVTLGTESIDYPGDTAYSRNLIPHYPDKSDISCGDNMILL